MIHPMQPLVRDADGVVRFQANAIIRHLVNVRAIDLNALATMGFSDEDQQQLAQLIGYSLGGYAELPYVTDAAYERAELLSRLVPGEGAK